MDTRARAEDERRAVRDPALAFEAVRPDAAAGRYLRRFWQPVECAASLPPGKARPLSILGEEFTLFRGADGAPQVVQARCPHRGTRLSTGWVEGDTLRCFYHGWRFAADGRCVEQPAEDPRAAPRISIRSYPTREYAGLIFAFFGDGEPPVLPRLKVLEDAPYRDVTRFVRACSYFNQIENSVDEVHINFVHRVSRFATAGYAGAVPRVVARETAYGIERISERGEEARIGHLLMPNVLMTTVPDPDNGWTQHVAWRVPIDDDRHVSFMVDVIELEGAALARYRERRAAEDAAVAALPPAEEVASEIVRGRTDLDAVADRPDLLSIQDSVALLGQAGAPRERDSLGRSDLSVALLRRIWTRELRALAADEPLTPWQWPVDIRVTTVRRAASAVAEAEA
ncbi:MAG TPA: Rieske 2Fe-2S domain-containing protein [Hyphomicrobiales bacterium]|nr:Rieske 2Fe-2S domain-containing protein [Hyphomicrobiales bacterium]